MYMWGGGAILGVREGLCVQYICVGVCLERVPPCLFASDPHIYANHIRPTTPPKEQPFCSPTATNTPIHSLTDQPIHDNSRFARQNYFDERGVFATVMFSGPLLLLALLQLVSGLAWNG